MGEVVMNCKYGIITKIVDGDSETHSKAIGINQAGLADLTPCRVDATDEDVFQNKKCSSTIDTGKIQADFDSKCKGKDHCKLQIYDFDTKDKFTKDYFPKAKENADCYKSTSQFFMQYTCEQPSAEQEKTYDEVSK